MIIMLIIILAFFAFMYYDLLNDDTMTLGEKYYYCGWGMLICLFTGFIQSVFYV